MAKHDLKVLFVSAEVSPYAKSGGLGDVAGALPKELHRQGVDVRVVFPKYRTIKPQLMTNLTYINSFEVMLDWRRQSASVFSIDADAPTYLIENDYYFGRDGFYGYGDDYERFAFFSKAAIEFCGVIDFCPDIIHFNDWQTGLGCIYLKDVYKKFLFFSKIKTLFTIHNLQYQGVFGREVLSNIELNAGYFVNDKIEFHGNLSLMKAGLTYTDIISTVSESYAQEIQTPQYGYGMDGVLRSRSHQLFGIVNGIDTGEYNPETDTRIFAPFSAAKPAGKAVNKAELQAMLHLPVRADVPVFGIISRLVDQKGFDLIAGIMEELMSKDVQLVVLGTGDGRYEHLFKHMSWRFPDKVSANILFNEELAHRIYAGSDFFLMPSLFEPCGLGQLLAMRYGTLPIVRRTGGLADTVRHYNWETGEGNGFVFDDYMMSGLMWGINEALSVYYNQNARETMIQNAMSADYSWGRSAEKYIDLYTKLKTGEI